MVTTTKTGAVNGSDIIFRVGGTAVGHCTSHEADFSTELKSRAFKPAASEPIKKARYDKKTPGKSSVIVNFDGLRFYDEAECGFKTFLALWHAGEPVECDLYERGVQDAAAAQPYFKGSFLISSLKESAPAEDDATYSGTLELCDEPEVVDPSKLTGETITE